MVREHQQLPCQTATQPCWLANGFMMTALALAVLVSPACRSSREGAAEPVPVSSRGMAAPAAAQEPDSDMPATPPAMETDGGPQSQDADAAEPGDPQYVQQEALEICQSASDFLDDNDTENAVAALDRAYELMLTLPDNGDVNNLQAKEDIRRWIAELLVRRYDVRAARPSAPLTSFDLSLPIVDNDHVKREIASFTNGERDQFLAAYKRSGRYLPMIHAKLTEAGLPSQIAWLPMVESFFKERALSRASALGLWQFIASTGMRYGLTRNAWLDERMDPEKATDAAIAYLTELHGLFGDWPKALAAYNCGEARVERLQRTSSGDYMDFWDLYALLPRETRRYVPRFFATLLILQDPQRYGVTLPTPDPPAPRTATVQVARAVQLDRLDAALSLPSGTLRSLNLELRHAATPPQPYDLRVPAGREGLVTASIAQIPEWQPPRPQYVTHRVGRGETLSGIASRYGTSVSAIMRANRIRSANRIWPGQRLQIPVRGGGGGGGRSPVVTAPGGVYTVQRGDSLSRIASQFGTSVARIKELNNLSSNTLYPGQTLRVSAQGSSSGGRAYVVKRGDTLGRIASAHRVSLAALLRANGLSSRSTIYPGQSLVIPE